MTYTSNPSRKTSSNGGRDPVLDGVRGLAILLVLFHHLVLSSDMLKLTALDWHFYALACSTWFGVDLFFVLSGFLITGILYEAKGSPTYFRSFYGRRVLRIFPLYYGFLAFAVLVFPLWLPPESAQNLRANQGWYWLYLSNFYVALEGWQYPLEVGHMWSLAVEEQFYLVWPLAVWALDRRRLLRVAAACFFGALLLRFFMPVGMHELSVYVLLPTRMDSLAAGAFLALVIRGDRGISVLGRWPVVLTGVCGVTVLALHGVEGTLRVTDPVVSTVGYTAIAACFAGMLAMAIAAHPRSLLRRALAATWLRFLGKYSYGLYVVHLPIIMLLADAGFTAKRFPLLLGTMLPGVAAFCVVGGFLSLVCAVAVFHLWEAPFLRLKRYLPYRVGANAGTVEIVPKASGFQWSDSSDTTLVQRAIR